MKKEKKLHIYDIHPCEGCKFAAERRFLGQDYFVCNHPESWYNWVLNLNVCEEYTPIKLINELDFHKMDEY